MKISVTIEGKTPLLCNRFGDQEQMDATNGTRLVNKGERGSPKEQAEKKLYLGCDGKTLMIPQPNVFRCIIDAGKFFKNGKSKVTTIKTSLIPACLELAGHDNPLEIPVRSKDGWTVDTRAVRIPATGGRIQAHRPCFHDWQLSFQLELDESEMSEKLLRDIVDAAGKKIGLGDFRPDCKGPFGKFVVIEWKKLK